jgi:hypothetical protein|tara:strand:- start:1939 stop:2313 length:375 start_codon:yes stop_codon:yes gene_type:complete
MNQLILLVAVSLGFAVSCTNTPIDLLATAKVPSFTAANNAFSCDQLYSEARRITGQMHAIADVRDENAEMERLEFVGGVLYWPVLLFVAGSSDSKAAQEEYNQLKGRLLNLSDLVISKQCGNGI